MYDVQARQVVSLPLAVVRGRANYRSIGAFIGQSLDGVYRFCKERGITSYGKNIAFYIDDPDRCLFRADEGVPMEVGVILTEAFENSDLVVRSQTPAGTVASVVHIGPYQKLPEAHAAVRKWCQQNGRALAGPNWEIYDHRCEGSDEPRTEVIYLLK
jgi:effector-binding domain-containing protein